MKPTAIQECIQEIDAKLILTVDYDDLSLYQRGIVDAYLNMKKLLESKLEKEKQDILNFASDYYYSDLLTTELFTKTFKQ
jgi:hypothetical protein